MLRGNLRAHMEDGSVHISDKILHLHMRFGQHFILNDRFFFFGLRIKCKGFKDSDIKKSCDRLRGADRDSGKITSEFLA